MSAAVSIYIYDHTPSGQSRLYKHIKFSVQYHMLCFKTYRVRCTNAVHYGPVFTPPTYACQRVKNLLYGTISYVVFQNIVITTVLFL